MSRSPIDETIAASLLLLLLLLSSCGRRPTPVYSYYESLSDTEWLSDRELFFTFSATEGGSYLLEGELRVSPDFSLRELPLGVVLESPSHHYTTSRLSVPIGERAVQTTGYLIRETSFVIQDHFDATETGDYTVSLRNLLRDSLIYGVVEVGVTVSRR